MNDLVKSIRAQHINDFLKGLLLTILAGSVAFGMVYGSIGKKDAGVYICIAVAAGIYAIFALAVSIQKLILVINPLKSDVFKKYGPPENVDYIYREIHHTIEYEDDSVIISRNYICNKKSVGEVIACNDVLAICKKAHKRYFIVDYYQIVITDKYGEELCFRYKVNEKRLVDNLVVKLKSKCRNAMVGNNQPVIDHIRRNKISLKEGTQSAYSVARPNTAPIPSPNIIKAGNYNLINGYLAKGFTENARVTIKQHILRTIEEIGPTRKTDLMKIVFSKIIQEFANAQGPKVDLIICSFFHIAFDEIVCYCGDMDVLLPNYSAYRSTGIVNQNVHKYVQMLVRLQKSIDGAIAVSANCMMNNRCSKEAYVRICNELDSYIDDSTAWNKI